MKRLYVLADANSIQYLEKFSWSYAEDWAVESYEGKGSDDDAGNLEGSKQTLPLLTKPPPSVALSVHEFVEYANKEDEVLRSLFPGESLSLLNSGEES